MEVYSYLKNLCGSNYILFISNTFISPKEHLNISGLHLNPKDYKKLRHNFVKYLKDLTSWETAKQNWLKECSRSKDNVCSSSRGTKTFDEKEFNSKRLRFLIKKYLNCVITRHININPIRNTYDCFIAIIKGNVDMLMLSETKLDEFFHWYFSAYARW